jgi:hypothetical protein
LEGIVATQSQTVKPGEPDPSLEFFLDDKPKLKSIFDNLRNYAICATLFAVSAWFKRGAFAVATPEVNQSHYGEHFISYSFLVSGIILTVLNIVQTYAVVGPPILNLFGWFHDLALKAGKKGNWLSWLTAELAKGISLFVFLTLLVMMVALIRASYFSISIGHK